MMHSVRGRKFGRQKDQRAALLRSLMRSLVIHGSIETTEARAKEIRGRLEKLVTRAKADTVANRRIVAARLSSESAVLSKLFKEIAPKMKERKGGYLRIVKLPKKVADGRPVVYIGFVE